VARVFPPIRPRAAVAGDAEVLTFLFGRGFAAERAAATEPLSATDGHHVLVTKHVDGVPPAGRRDAIKAAGGLRRLGEMLAELHVQPAASGAAARPGGGWHHLVDGSPADEIAAARALLAARADDDEAAADRAQHAELSRALADLDDGTGLPESLIHPDFVLANVVASPDRGMVLVDWTGAGRGPRAWSLAFLLYAEGARGLPRVDLVVAGYRRHITPAPEELSRLQAMIAARPVVLAVWSYCLGRRSLADAVRSVTQARALAAEVGPRAVSALRTVH
jgi:Ser/Thr protein kinase RdoA (MazF antagonist)